MATKCGVVLLFFLTISVFQRQAVKSDDNNLSVKSTTNPSQQHEHNIALSSQTVNTYSSYRSYIFEEASGGNGVSKKNENDGFVNEPEDNLPFEVISQDENFQYERGNSRLKSELNPETENSTSYFDFKERQGKGHPGKRKKREISPSTSSYVASTLTQDVKESYDNMNNMTRLMKNLYDKPEVIFRVQPKTEDIDNSSVQIEFHPIKILSVDELEGSVAISAYIQLTWRDDSLFWNQNEFNIDENILLEASKVWTPTIFLPDSNGQGLYLEKTEFVKVWAFDGVRPNKRGNVWMNVPFQFTVSCDLNLSNYPFDEQNCSVVFAELYLFPLEAWESYDERNDALIADSVRNSEWELIDVKSGGGSRNKFMYCLEYTISMKRKSTFYIANLLTPLFLTSFATTFVFWIPAECGEKISFLVSMFVSMSVFSYLINDSIPRSISDLPKFNALVLAVYSEIALAFMATMFVLHRFHSRENTIDDKLIAVETSTDNHKTAMKVDMGKNEKCSTLGDNVKFSPCRPKSQIKYSANQVIKVSPVSPISTSKIHPEIVKEKPDLVMNVTTPEAQPHEERHKRKSMVAMGLRKLHYQTLDQIFFVLFLIYFVCTINISFLYFTSFI